MRPRVAGRARAGRSAVSGPGKASVGAATRVTSPMRPRVAGRARAARSAVSGPGKASASAATRVTSPMRPRVAGRARLARRVFSRRATLIARASPPTTPVAFPRRPRVAGRARAARSAVSGPFRKASAGAATPVTSPTPPRVAGRARLERCVFWRRATLFARASPPTTPVAFPRRPRVAGRAPWPGTSVFWGSARLDRVPASRPTRPATSPMRPRVAERARAGRLASIWAASSAAANPSATPPHPTPTCGGTCPQPGNVCAQYLGARGASRTRTTRMAIRPVVPRPVAAACAPVEYQVDAREGPTRGPTATRSRAACAARAPLAGDTPRSCGWRRRRRRAHATITRSSPSQPSLMARTTIRLALRMSRRMWR
jgi:hypothetical protein